MTIDSSLPFGIGSDAGGPDSNWVVGTDSDFGDSAPAAGGGSGGGSGYQSVPDELIETGNTILSTHVPAVESISSQVSAATVPDNSWGLLGQATTHGMYVSLLGQLTDHISRLQRGMTAAGDTFIATGEGYQQQEHTATGSFNDIGPDDGATAPSASSGGGGDSGGGGGGDSGGGGYSPPPSVPDTAGGTTSPSGQTNAESSGRSGGTDRDSAGSSHSHQHERGETQDDEPGKDEPGKSEPSTGRHSAPDDHHESSSDHSSHEPDASKHADAHETTRGAHDNPRQAGGEHEQHGAHEAGEHTSHTSSGHAEPAWPTDDPESHRTGQPGGAHSADTHSAGTHEHSGSATDSSGPKHAAPTPTTPPHDTGGQHRSPDQGQPEYPQHHGDLGNSPPTANPSQHALATPPHNAPPAHRPPQHTHQGRH